MYLSEFFRKNIFETSPVFRQSRSDLYHRIDQKSIPVVMHGAMFCLDQVPAT